MAEAINIHPFPARMASDLALAKTDELHKDAKILDPMTGSGTVIQAAARNGLEALGLDVDPLAVLISKVATSQLNEERFLTLVDRVICRATSKRLREITLPWFDRETTDFAKYWFAAAQRRALKRLAHVLHSSPSLADDSAEANAVRVAISRLIITKERGASLARDVSHSRPHKVTDENDFDVFEELRRSARIMAQRLAKVTQGPKPVVRLGDARVLPWVRAESIDMILTSPPYLNAIDYMRGHRLSLIWLGHNLRELRSIRSGSVGAERGPDAGASREVERIKSAFGKVAKLPLRHQAMIERYSSDLLKIMRQSERVLKPNGRMVVVIGNSRLESVSISNARGLEAAALGVGLRLEEEQTRRLPRANRYLPIPLGRDSALGRRMRTETVMTFVRPRAA